MSTTGSGTFRRLGGYLLNAVPDEQDLRDYPCRPALVRLRSEVPRLEEMAGGCRVSCWLYDEGNA